MNSDLFPLRK